MKTRLTSRAGSGEERRSAAKAPDAMKFKGTATMPDTRASSLAQLQHQQLASNSGQAAQLRARAEMMAGRGADAPMQRVEDEELLQGKWAVPSEMPVSSGAPAQLMTLESRASDGSEIVVFSYQERQPDRFGVLGTDGYQYTLMETGSSSAVRYRRKKAAFKGYGTFGSEPVTSELFDDTEKVGLIGLSETRRATKLASHTKKNPLSGETYGQFSLSAMKESYAEAEPLVEESDSLKKHRVRGLKKNAGGFVGGKILDKVTGVPISGALDTLSTAKSAFDLTPDADRGGYVSIGASKSVDAAKAAISLFLAKKAGSKAIGVGGGVGGAIGGAALGSVVPVVGTVIGGIAGGVIGGKVASAAADAASSADTQVEEVRFAMQMLHREARDGDADAFSALSELGLGDHVIAASDGWKAGLEALGI